MIFNTLPPEQNPLKAAITAAYRSDETARVEALLKEVNFSQDSLERIANTARNLVIKVRESRFKKGGMDAFMDEYDLSTQEGIALMCMAEALLRIPDKQTKDLLIQEKLSGANWESHLGASNSLFVNASTWGLMITGQLLSQNETKEKSLLSHLKNWIAKTGQPIIRKAVDEAMRILGQQFVMGETIEEALKRAVKHEARGYRYSYDMLGEAAHTAEDAEHYLKSYEAAIAAIKNSTHGRDLYNSPGISIKLSALYPRYERAQADKAIPALSERLLGLAQQAKSANINLTVDAEEMERLELSLNIIENVFSHISLQDWEGFGLAVQAYQKRATFVLDWLIDLCRRHKKRMMVRLVKGAYWDTDIKDSQVRGLEGYAVFTRKSSTDLSYIVCAKKLIEAEDAIYPQFATHNAQTVSVILEMLKGRKNFEFQCLQGMGQPLYDHIVGPEQMDFPCRIYAPVGVHQDLLPYLVRRLLENGANTSFVNRIINKNVNIEDIIADPIAKVCVYESIPHPQIPLPANIYPNSRKNSLGLDFGNIEVLRTLSERMNEFANQPYSAGPMIGKTISEENAESIQSPQDHRKIVGTVKLADESDIEIALSRAVSAQQKWNSTPVDERASILEKIADLLEEHHAELMTLIIREAGRTIGDALSEIREAVDFCRYYAMQAREELIPMNLPGATGESNQLQMHGRGTFLCISPWNFPLAIFVGQITAALVAGNTVIGKPAEQTPLIAARAIELMWEAGIPNDVVQLMPGSGQIIGAKLVADPRISGVLFTGSTETARSINQSLAHREGPIARLIAETGGQNAMIVDSSALPEQVVIDTLLCAFGSAGQRCSALRVLFLQEEIADKVITMLKGAMAELVVGDPCLLSTDIGPVIDLEARKVLENHIQQMNQIGQLIASIPLSESCQNGSFFSPCAYEIPSLDLLTREVFGPILHVIRYKSKELDQVIEAINQTHYGLTFGIQTRINERMNYIYDRVAVGNAYVNRNTIGAVVGVQPFGGEGLSGTGPKAGGPHYLAALCAERVLSINTTATGGNTQLMSLNE